MYTVYAKNYTHTVDFEETYLEFEFALQVYYTSRKAVDCESVGLMNALTGEILKDWHYREGEWFSPSFKK